MKKETASLNIPGLRARLEEVTKDRDRAKVVQHKTQAELERTKKALQEYQEEYEELSKDLEEKVQQTDILQKQAVEQASDIASYRERINALVEEAKTLRTRRPKADTGKGAPGRRHGPNGGYTPGLDFMYTASPSSPPSPPSFLAPEVQRRATLRYSPEAKSPPPPYSNASEQELADARQQAAQIGRELDTYGYLHNRTVLQDEYNWLLTEHIPQLEQEVLDRQNVYSPTMPQPAQPTWPF
jgi:hypothetical protein